VLEQLIVIIDARSERDRLLETLAQALKQADVVSSHSTAHLEGCSTLSPCMSGL
jgi:hypothetical protein